MTKYYNRSTKKYEIEKIAGEKYLNWTYSSALGMSFLELIIKKKLFSKIYGFYCDSSLSKSKINKFINDFNIDMTKFEKNIDDFSSFNDFFIRKLKSNIITINTNDNILISPGDGRLTAYENIDLNKIVQIKGFTYSLLELIQNDAIANNFQNGTCLILRLCPTDYHRFHFIDNGICETSHNISGSYYSVNPIALKKIPELFCKNKREWSLFHSENFGDILYVEVGATCVGSIIQTYKSNVPIIKGDEKGYFKFGGSTTVLFFQPNTIKMHDDILNQSKLGYETKVSFGENIGCKK